MFWLSPMKEPYKTPYPFLIRLRVITEAAILCLSS
jgi:hypothetical protein